ncbi:amidohydrolase [Pseudonocardia kujensis]|uniref:amidohydrolase family protein n=1 Tax=Pseudonocardia kujensis TaxID=1128675 RepID=UPI001E4ADFF8|nr:amidohydrolase family protein [Pseudonocardia kujensis]MCE0766873.1 amidohydrolase [Pseudonocardia kujensis]
MDLHAHVIPDDYRRLLVTPAGDRPFVVSAPLEGLEENMERYGIDAAVISVGPPGAYLGEQQRANELARAANESLGAIMNASPDRFGVLALLPLPDVEAALFELAYALDQLHLDGVLLFSNVAGTYLGDPAWEPLYSELDRRGAYAFVHPGAPPYALPLGADHPIWLYEFPFDTTRALTHLIYTGTLERYPRIRFQFSHLGGVAPFLAGRLASLAERQPELATAASAGSSEYLRRQYYDTGLSQSLAALTATRAVAPLEQIVFGTDWPYAALPEEGSDPAPEFAALSPAEREAVDHRNAARLVPRLVRE